MRIDDTLAGDDRVERYELREPPAYRFESDRREFVQVLGAGLVIAVSARAAFAQRGSRGGRGSRGDAHEEKLSTRFHIDSDGVVTVMTGKVEVGQGSRTQLAQAAAEELRLPLEKVRLIMGDTALCPDDGGTAGSRTTPANVPQIRHSAALANELLCGLAAKQLNVDRAAVKSDRGVYSTSAGQQITLAELVDEDKWESQSQSALPKGVALTRVDQWRVLGQPVPKLQSEAVVTGAAMYPSDISRPGMLYGKVLRAPAYNASLQSIDLDTAKKLSDVAVVRDGDFVGCTAKTSWAAAKALDALAATAKWDTKPQPSSDELFDHLKQHATTKGNGWPRPRSEQWGDGPAKSADAAHHFQASYQVAYIQHAPMEPRAAVAEWTDGNLTVWTGSQMPFRVQSELCSAFRLPPERVRVIVPDTGGGFGGKHSGEDAIEAARLAKAAGKPVSLRWTRAEEFTWAYFRPAALIEVESGLDKDGRLVAWDFTNYNSGESSIGMPYESPHGRTRFLASQSPLRQGSYRALAATANNFARESAMDELALLAGADPLHFRMAHLPDGRLKDVLKAAADKFGWQTRRDKPEKNRGVGLACGTDKGSFVAACAEVEVVDHKVKVLSVCQAFDCGAVQNPLNLRSQNEGAIVMGLGGALREEIRFKDGRLENASFGKYRVPRIGDLPDLDVVLVNRPDVPSAGAGETPIIAIAPAIANAIHHAAGVRRRAMPMLKDGLLRDG